MRVLLIGPLPPPLGGATVSFQHLVSYVNRMIGAQCQVVDTSGARGRRFGVVEGFLRSARILGRMAWYACRSDVISLHCSATALPSLGFVGSFLARVLRRPLIIRQFGGADYSSLGGVRGRLAHWAVSGTFMFLVQTNHLVSVCRDRGLHQAAWYPTSRPVASERMLSAESDDLRCSKFVYVGRVAPSKGIREILHVSPRLPEDVRIDVLGPLGDGMTLEEFKNVRGVRYLGPIEPDALPELLRQYHALVLPTYYTGEGYPGVIIEAYNAGIPVICTRWMQLPELVDDSCGILIPIQDPQKLLEAMLFLFERPEEYRRLREGAWNKRTEFSAQYWAEYLISCCEKAMEGARN